MTLFGWLVFFLILQGIHGLGTWKLYTKVNRKAWEAFVPVYNAIVLMKIINRPAWWVILLFIPIVNLLMFPIIWIETIRSFKRNSNQDTALVLLTFGFYIYYINYFVDVEYKENRSLKPLTTAGEWVGSIAYAIIAATLVHTYIMRPYTIPTSSLEKSLLVGDYLFVSKFHYGARVPMTAVSFPMVHDSIPLTGLRSYLKKPQIPYFRLPGIQKIKRNEIVVFNWPADSLKTMWGDNSGEFTYKPIDKKTNYVKRCVAIAGDTLQIIDGEIYINGELSVMPDRAKPQQYYYVDTEGQRLPNSVLDRFNTRKEGGVKDGKYYLNLTKQEAAAIARVSGVKSVTKDIQPMGEYNKKYFPHDPQYPWNDDNYGPIYIPEGGATVALNEKTFCFYEHLIREYEHNDVEIKNNKMYINGQAADTYTFKQDYYWMMGDNRQRSLDARVYGFTPFDHVVGKPVFIWFSKDNITGKIRWDRMFTTVHGEGKPVSYLKYFIIVVIIWQGIAFYRKRKNKKIKLD